MQRSIFDLQPNEIEMPFAYGDYVQGRHKDTNEIVRGYICEIGLKWLILSDAPRCGWKQNGPGIDYGNLPTCGFIPRATAQRTTSPEQTTQREIF